MKKNDLIKYLQGIKGNPDIKLYNGFVGDWMDIDLIESEVVKECDEFIRFYVEGEWKQNNKTDIIPHNVQIELDKQIEQRIKSRRTEDWEFPNQYLSEDQYKKWYGKHRKKIILINGKKRGKSSYDRLGRVEY